MSPFADFPPCRRSLTLGNRRRGTEEAQLKTRERIAVSPGFCAPTKTGLHPNCRLEGGAIHKGSLLNSRLRIFYDKISAVRTGRFAASHPTMPPAISPTGSNPLRCNKLAAMEDR